MSHRALCGFLGLLLAAPASAGAPVVTKGRPAPGQPTVVIDARPLTPDPARLKALGLEPSDVQGPGPAGIPYPPPYPEAAKEARIEGDVHLRCVIEETGVVDKCEVTRRLTPECDQASVARVAEWKYRPARIKGKPVATFVTFVIHFRLNPAKT
jgi:TonB family protein